MKSLELLYKAYYKKIRGKAKEGYIRPTIQEFFTTHPDYVEILKGTVIGEKYVFNDTYTNFCDIVNLGDGKFVVAYSDYGNSRYGTAVVGNISGNSITFGQPVVFEQAETWNISMTFDYINNKIVIFYGDYGNSRYLTAVVGTVSGNSVSFNIPVVIHSNIAYSISSDFESETGSIVVAYRRWINSSDGLIRIVRVVDGSISFSPYDTINFDGTYYTSTTFDPVSNKVFIFYSDYGEYIGNPGDPSYYGKYGVAEVVSDYSILMYGSNFYQEPSYFVWSKIYYISSVFNPIDNKIVVVYSDQGRSGVGRCRVASVSDYTLNFYSTVTFSDSPTGHTSVVHDSYNNKIIISYRDDGNSGYGTVIAGTITDNGIEFETPIVFNSNGTTNFISSTYDELNNKVVITYRDDDNSFYGTVISIAF